MSEELISSISFEKKDFTQNALQKGEYEDCTFLDCNFANTNLSEISFSECLFKNCDLSNTKLNHTALKDVEFNDCKILGVNFSVCNPFLLELQFSNCQLNFASFYKLKLKGIKFINCNLQEADFVETDLRNAMFDNCDLQNAMFENTMLEKANFYTAYNYSIDPEMNALKNAVFSKEEVIGLLNKYPITIK